MLTFLRRWNNTQPYTKGIFTSQALKLVIVYYLALAKPGRTKGCFKIKRFIQLDKQNLQCPDSEHNSGEYCSRVETAMFLSITE